MGVDDQKGKVTEVILLDFRARVVAATKEIVSRNMKFLRPSVFCLRLPDPKQILMTPAHLPLDDLSPHDLWLLSIGGDILETPNGFELPNDFASYLKTFQDRGDVHALGHFHSIPDNIDVNSEHLIDSFETTSIYQKGELLQVECRECPSRFTGLCSCRTDFDRHYSGAKILILKENGFITMATDLEAVVELADTISQNIKSSHTS